VLYQPLNALHFPPLRERYGTACLYAQGNRQGRLRWQSQVSYGCTYSLFYLRSPESYQQRRARNQAPYQRYQRAALYLLGYLYCTQAAGSSSVLTARRDGHIDALFSRALIQAHPDFSFAA